MSRASFESAWRQDRVRLATAWPQAKDDGSIGSTFGLKKIDKITRADRGRTSGANDPAISRKCCLHDRPDGRGTADMPNLFVLMSDESDHRIAGDKLRGNDEGPYRRP
jgi:hypothetical protein